ncbi:MAG TPA: protein phosphatase 2C domain-containing protein [Streptosporangiaceae bacterium]
MQTSLATQGAPGRANEDYAAAGTGWALVLDGATPVPGVASGCRHDVPWLVRRLAAALAARLALADPASAASLADIVAGAIGETMAAHAGTCDLDHPDSPSSTVSVARIRENALEYLVLCDSPILLRRSGGRLTLLADDRLERLAGGGPLSAGLVREGRNRPGGFWVASTDPDAAYQAVRGAVSLDTVTDVALLTDGVTRLADWYGYAWADIFARLRDTGPAGLIGLVRAAEHGYPHPFGKQHDDATAVLLSR